MARAKKNFENQKQEYRIASPESVNDLLNLGELLQTYETSIILNWSKEKKITKDTINKVLEYLLTYKTSYMNIQTKKVFTKVYVITSTRNRFI